MTTEISFTFPENAYRIGLQPTETGRTVTIAQTATADSRTTSITVSEPEFLEFIVALGKIAEDLGVDLAGNSRTYTVEEKRIENPKAYMPWTPEEEDLLKELHQQGVKVAQLSSRLQRNRGAIQARIKKLGLAD